MQVYGVTGVLKKGRRSRNLFRVVNASPRILGGRVLVGAGGAV